MANWTNLKAAIAETITVNGNQEITGAVLQNTLNAIVNTVGANATFAGVATPTTSPGVPDGPVFYLAGISGAYSNFGVTLQDEIAVITNTSNGSWTKSTVLGAATTESAGVMSAEDKENLDSLPIRLGDVNVIELEQSQFSNLIWSETRFLPANNNYNSYILRVPEQTSIVVSSSANWALFAFKESPYVGYSTQDFIRIKSWLDYPEGLPNGYGYLVIMLSLSSSSNYDVVVTIGEHGLGKRISTLSKRIDAEIVPTVNNIVVYETEATFNNGFILPNNGNLPITDNAAYVHTLMDCVEGQKFIVSAKCTQYVYAWQFLDSANNILIKYDNGETPVVDTVIIAPFGAKKLLVNSSIKVNYSVKFWISNNPENVLSKEIKEASDKIKEIKDEAVTFDSRITNIEDECDNIKGIVGEPPSVIDLTTSDYSGLVYGGTSFVKASPSYDSFIFPLTQGNTYKIVNNTDLSYEQAGISTIFTFSVTPALGEIGYVRKLYAGLLESFTPQNNERYLVVNINKSTFIDNNLTYISGTTGLLKRIEELEDNFSKPLQGKTILCLGDSITEFKYQDKRYSDYLAEITGANVINGGIGGTQMGRRTAIPSTAVFSNNPEAYACLDLPSIAYSLNTGDFTMQEDAAQWLVSDSNPNKTTDDNTAIVEVLKSVNLDSIDIVTIFIGTNDIGQYLGKIGESGGDASYLNISQGFYEIIKNLLTKNPNLRIYYFCPMPRYFGDVRTFDPSTASTNSDWCDNYEVNGIKFPNMVDHQIKLAEYFKIPVCDMYRTMGINQWNILSIMRGDISDGTHPYKGFKMIANKIASFIIANNNLNI